MKPNRIMIVDDSPVELQHLKEIVSDSGYQVITAVNGQDAYDKAKTYKPDVILMDVVMDGIDGFEACRNIIGETDRISESKYRRARAG